MTQVISIGLNELDFGLLEQYTMDGTLPTFRALLDQHDLMTTIAEHEQHQLEPWIQWVTVHTGLRFEQHQVFRLGDIVATDHPQIWEILEQRFGLRVGAISPMNARNSLSSPAFFMPDPWTKTRVDGSWDLKLLTQAIIQAVNDNAHAKVSIRSQVALLLGLLLNAAPINYRRYAQLLFTSKQAKWGRALFLDQLLTDVFIRNVRRSRPDYASLFLNAGAHIQHNYLFSSKYYQGPLRNPEWYLPAGFDPIADVYRLYDRLISQIRSAFPKARILLCTGLSQKPNHDLISFYRPKEHAELLRALGIDTFVAVEPRMSRDFLVTFGSGDAAAQAQQQLASFVAPDGSPIFTVDNRGLSLFCMLAYTGYIDKGFGIKNSEKVLPDFDQWVSHVNIENGVHQAEGFFMDTGKPKTGQTACIPLERVFQLTVDMFSPQVSG
ncbi:hypothetical protein EWI61_10920 [Methylolobus aquaticus]|nr:hypothetical protein EWI61_10920 [Methylolobus aquaticus]